MKLAMLLASSVSVASYAMYFEGMADAIKKQEEVDQMLVVIMSSEGAFSASEPHPPLALEKRDIIYMIEPVRPVDVSMMIVADLAAYEMSLIAYNELFVNSNTIVWPMVSTQSFVKGTLTGACAEGEHIETADVSSPVAHPTHLTARSVAILERANFLYKVYNSNSIFWI